MAHAREDILEERRRLRLEYAGLFDQVQALLFRHDPMGINFDFNTDEYDPEVGTILPRLSSCASSDDVCRVVHQEFVRWFGEDLVGSKERFAQMSAEIWQLWKAFRSAEPGTAGNSRPPSC